MRTARRAICPLLLAALVVPGAASAATFEERVSVPRAGNITVARFVLTPGEGSKPRLRVVGGAPRTLTAVGGVSRDRRRGRFVAALVLVNRGPGTARAAQSRGVQVRLQTSKPGFSVRRSVASNVADGPERPPRFCRELRRDISAGRVSIPFRVLKGRAIPGFGARRAAGLGIAECAGGSVPESWSDAYGFVGEPGTPACTLAITRPPGALQWTNTLTCNRTISRFDIDAPDPFTLVAQTPPFDTQTSRCQIIQGGKGYICDALRGSATDPNQSGGSYPANTPIVSTLTSDQPVPAGTQLEFRTVIPEDPSLRTAGTAVFPP